MMTVLMMGFVVGLVMSAPIGPMAALAALRWSEGAIKAAIGIAAGVCLGDVILAMVAMVIVSASENAGLMVPEWVSVSIGVVVLAGCGGWLIATSQRDVKPANAGGDVISAVLVTLLHPANVGAFVFMFMMWLPKMGVHINGLGIYNSVLLLSSCLLGMIVGWGAFLWLVQRLVVKFGRPTHKAKRRFARVIGLVMIFAAAMLLI
jgi:threonine/homoserine/homoserine lactone efflux protein